MASGLITSFLGEGLAASRPADPDVAGAIAFYWSTDTNEMSAWLENAWVEDVFGTGGALLVANNLSDVASAATAATNLGLGTADSPQFTGVNIGHASDTTVTRTGAGDIAVEGNAIYRAGGTDVPLADGGTGASLSDPGADRIMFWDDSAGAVTWLTAGTNLTITGTTIDASGGGAGWTLVDTWENDIDGAVATFEVDVTGADEVLIDMHEVAHSASAHRIVQVRTTAGGATYYTASGEYADIASTGALTNQTGYYPHATATTAARSCVMVIRNVSGSVSPKFAALETRAMTGRFTGNSTAITHVRVGGVTGAGSTPTGTLQGSGAAIRVYTR